MTRGDVISPGLSLVGYRGTGKTTVGSIVARELGWSFVDADRTLEARAGRSIRSIFEQEGEAAFRDLEEQVIAEHTSGPPVLIATGGGVVLRESNRRALRAFGTIVWLTASAQTLAQRISCLPESISSRPALTASGTVAEIADVLAERLSLYRTLADFEVSTEGLTYAQVADAIIAIVKNHHRPPANQ